MRRRYCGQSRKGSAGGGPRHVEQSFLLDQGLKHPSPSLKSDISDRCEALRFGKGRKEWHAQRGGAGLLHGLLLYQAGMTIAVCRLIAPTLSANHTQHPLPHSGYLRFVPPSTAVSCSGCRCAITLIRSSSQVTISVDLVGPEQLCCINKVGKQLLTLLNLEHEPAPALF